MKIVVVLLMVGVLGALASAGVFMLRRGRDGQADTTDRPKHMARALALRVALSLAVFLFILLGWHMGWVQPTGIPVAQ